MALINILEKSGARYREVSSSKDLNKSHLKLNDLGKFKDSTIHLFNSLYLMCRKENFKQGNLTPSGGLSVVGVNRLPTYWLRETTAGVDNPTYRSLELYIFLQNRLYGFIIGRPRETGTNTGLKFYKRFLEGWHLANKDISKYALEPNSAFALKLSIQKPLIKTIDNWYPATLSYYSFDHVYHLDIHEAYKGALIDKIPERQEVAQALDNKYQDHKDNKDTYNLAVGYCQSKYINYKYTYFAKIAIEWTRERVLAEARRIKQKGGLILGYNTDGVFYRMPDGKAYNDRFCGDSVGMFHNDREDMLWVPIKANWVCLDGYKDGVRGFYKALRGNFGYGEVKDYDDWNCWDDILKALSSEYSNSLLFDINKGYQIIKHEPLIKIKGGKIVNKTEEYLRKGISLSCQSKDYTSQE